jgi:hypothetical protein
MIHTSREVGLALASRLEIQIQFLLKYACWLNLIEPWWKQLNHALYEGVAYWNDRCPPYSWKKRTQEQLPELGGFRVHLRSRSLFII